MIRQRAFPLADVFVFRRLHAQRGEDDLWGDAFDLDGIAGRGVVVRGGEFDGAAMVERDDGLHAAFAESRLADDDGAMLILQGASYDF